MSPPPPAAVPAGAAEPAAAADWVSGAIVVAGDVWVLLSNTTGADLELPLSAKPMAPMLINPMAPAARSNGVLLPPEPFPPRGGG
jgi:hypothetical protein